jgi:hypothetical protein
MKRAGFWWVLLMGALALEAVAEDAAPTLVDVAPAHLDGRRLVLKDLNASVEAPGPEWRWVTWATPRATGAIKVHSYVCLRTDDAFRIVFSITESGAVQTEKQAKEFAEGACTSAYSKKMGFTLTRFESAKIPVPGKSWRYELHGSSTTDGSPVTWVGYVTGTDLTYSFAYTTGSSEWSKGEEEYKQCVGSFLFLTPPKISPQPSLEALGIVAIAGWGAGFVGIMALGTCAGLAGIRSTASRTAGILGCILIVLSFVLPALLVPALLPAGQDPKEAGRKFGRALGYVLCIGVVPAGGLALALRSLVRKPQELPFAPQGFPGPFSPPFLPPPG